MKVGGFSECMTYGAGELYRSGVKNVCYGIERNGMRRSNGVLR